MEIKNLLTKPLWQMTGEEFLFLSKSGTANIEASNTKVVDVTSPKYVYGLSGIANLFDCSIPTANRIKKSGKIDKAIKQIRRKIIDNAELALQLAGEKKGGRR